jgi:protection-of-telomeres protein 1
MPPKDFTPINNATNTGEPVSLIGVIVSVQEPKKTRGSDWVLDFTIQDDFSTGAGGIGIDASIKCRLFKPSPTMFPKHAVGDVALLRNFKLNEFMMRHDAIYDSRSRLCGALVFPAKDIPDPEFSEPFQTRGRKLAYHALPNTREPTIEEQMAAIHLKHAASGILSEVKQFAATAPIRPAAQDKLSLIKDLTFDRFYDIKAQVVNTYYNSMGTVDLKVTDYTSNKDLFLYVDPDDEFYSLQMEPWQGPYGQFTINIILWGNNAAWARENVRVGDYVYLKNVHTKMSPMNKLEGALHDDRFRPNQIDIRKLLHGSDIREIDARRKQYDKDYEKNHAKKSAFDDLQNEPKKPSAKASANKKAEKRARQRAQKEQELQEIAEKAEGWEAERSNLNLNSESISKLRAIPTKIV